MKKSINIHKFADAFDDFAKSHGNFIEEFVQYRGDFISSDREAASFMFAMEKYLN